MEDMAVTVAMVTRIITTITIFHITTTIMGIGIKGKRKRTDYLRRIRQLPYPLLHNWIKSASACPCLGQMRQRGHGH